MAVFVLTDLIIHVCPDCVCVCEVIVIIWVHGYCVQLTYAGEKENYSHS